MDYFHNGQCVPYDYFIKLHYFVADIRAPLSMGNDVRNWKQHVEILIQPVQKSLCTFVNWFCCVQSLCIPNSKCVVRQQSPNRNSALNLMIIALNFLSVENKIKNIFYLLFLGERNTLSLFLSHSFIKLSIIVKILLISLFNKRSFQQKKLFIWIVLFENFPNLFFYIPIFI